MNAEEAWHFLITHCREIDVRCGPAEVKITVSDERWRTVMRHGEVTEKAEGTHTHDLLTYLAYVSRKANNPASIPQGQPFTAADGLWLSHSDWNAGFSTSEGRRVGIRNDAGARSIVPLLEFQSSHP